MNLPKGLNDSLRNPLARILKRKVAGIDEMKLRFGDIAQVGPGTLDREEGIVLTPHDQGFWLFVAEERLSLVIVREIGLVVVEEIELDGIVAGTVEKKLVHCV